MKSNMADAAILKI